MAGKQTWRAGVGFGTVCLLARLSLAVETAPPASPEAARPRLPTIQLQPADEPALPLAPVKNRTPEEQKKLDAVSHYMAGELLLERDKTDEAIRELAQAIDLDPTATAPYRLLIPAAVRANDIPQAKKYALLATEHAVEGVQLLRGLVAVLIQSDQIPEAIKVLKEALQLQGVEAGSFESLVLQRHLAQCYQVENQKDEAAKTYQDLFNAVRDPNRKKLSRGQRMQVFGEDGALYDEMGTAFLEAKLPEPAVEAFDEAAKLRKSVPGVHGYNLATVFRQTGKPDRALEELNKYLNAQLSEKGRAPYLLLKELLTELQRPEELLPRLEEMQEKDKHNRFLAFFLADEYVSHDKLDAARELYEKTSGGNAPESLIGLAMVQRRTGDFEGWLKNAGKAFSILQLANPGVLMKLSPELQDLANRFNADLDELAKAPDQMDKLVEVARKESTGDDAKLEFDTAWLVARVAADAERIDDAAHFYRFALGLQNLPPYQMFHEFGATLVEAKRYKEAEQVFQEAADHPSLEPAKSFFLSLVSVAQEMDGRIPEALESIQEARRLDADQPRYTLQEARIYYRARRWDEAAKLFEMIIEKYPKNKEQVRDTRFSLSALYVQKGEFEKGEQILLDVLKEEPDQPQANNDLGYLWADRNVHLDRAEGMIRKALAAEPENSAYLDSLGWVLFRLGKYDEAIKHLEQAASGPRGEDPTILDHLAECQAKSGRQEQALENWRKALTLEEEKPAPDPALVESLKKKIAGEAPSPEAK